MQVFQEVTSSLPQEDRIELAELIQQLQMSKSKKSSTKRWSNTLPHSNSKIRMTATSEVVAKYTPKEESAGVKINESRTKEAVKLNNVNLNSLIGTCRAARIREDSSVFLLKDNFKIKSLLNKSESFKY